MPHVRLTLLFLLLLASPAGAFDRTRVIEGRADCVQAPGAPGELVVGGDEGVRVLRASTDGFALGERLPFSYCARVATRAGGAGVAAAWTPRGLVAVVRDPKGRWSEPTVIGGAGPTGSGVTVAISDNGNAIVAWFEVQIIDATERSYQLRVARRAPGGTFGAPETIATSTDNDSLQFELGTADNGDAFVMTWTEEGFRPPIRMPVKVAMALAGGTFGAPVELGQVPWRSRPALTVAADGRALAVLPDGTALRVAERAPGEGFGAPAPIVPATDAVGVTARAVAGPGGQAAVVTHGTYQGEVQVLTRAAPGPFTSASVAHAAPLPADHDGFYTSEWFSGYSGIFDIGGGSQVQLALTPDGQAQLASPWFERRDGLWTNSAGHWTVPLGAAKAHRHSAGTDFRPAQAALPLTLTDGRPAVAWLAVLDGMRLRIHLAADGATTPATHATPRVRVGKPRNRLVKAGEDLQLPVTCSAACELSAEIAGHRTDGFLRLERGGRGTLKLRNDSSDPIAPVREGAVRIRLSYGPLDTQHPRTRTLTLRLRRPKDLPVAHPLRLRASRDRDTIRVTWRTDRPTTRSDDGYTVFWVTGDATEDHNAEPVELRETESHNGRSAFHVTLTRNTADVHYVTLRTEYIGGTTADERVTIAVP